VITRNVLLKLENQKYFWSKEPWSLPNIATANCQVFLAQRLAIFAEFYCGFPQLL
jgi:hypothetical protein